MVKYLLIYTALVLILFLSGCDQLDELIEGDTNKPTDGTIEGNVSLENATEHGEVNISLKGTAFTAISQSDGSFQISDVPKGDYSVSFDLDGFVTLDEEVEVIAGDVTHLEVFLQQEIPMPPVLPNP
ncbi:carboxypeptidase-like regulatory domain-containing protein [Candidatus Poribacteria bacterium]